MPSAAWRPSQMAVTTRSDPRTISPPAKIFGFAVWNAGLVLWRDDTIPIVTSDATSENHAAGLG